MPSDRSGAHLSRQLPLIHFLQGPCRECQGCRGRRGTDGDETRGRGLTQGGAIEACDGLDISGWSRHLSRSREGSRSDQEHAISLLPHLERHLLVTRRPPGLPERRVSMHIMRPPSDNGLGIAQHSTQSPFSVLNQVEGLAEQSTESFPTIDSLRIL